MVVTVTNSSFTIYITIQNWTPDNSGTFYDNLARKGFTVQPFNPLQLLQGQLGQNVRKGTTTSLSIENVFRRIVMTVTNEINDPSRNIEEVLDALSATGFPAYSIERIDINGNITVGVENAASTFVGEVVKKEFVSKATEIFGREVIAVGIRLASAERLSSGVVSSPFYLLIEPMIVDGSDTKFLVQLTFSSADISAAMSFMQSLYEKLKRTVSQLKSG